MWYPTQNISTQKYDITRKHETNTQTNNQQGKKRYVKGGGIPKQSGLRKKNLF